MFEDLPQTAQEFLTWPWEQIEPYVDELMRRSLDPIHLEGWLADWSRLSRLLEESYDRLHVATSIDTTNPESAERMKHYLDEIFPNAQAANQKLKEKLLASKIAPPPGFEIPLRNMRAEASLYRQANLPLLSQEIHLANEYDRIIGDQVVNWKGRELPLPQLKPVYQDPDRGEREQAWRLSMQRQLADREAINRLWGKFLDLRLRIAANAGFDDYRSYRWKRLLRFDYTPQDCERFERAIEQVVVPAIVRRHEKRRRLLGLDTLRPWDLEVDPRQLPPLRPFRSVEELIEGAAAIFHQVDAQLGEYFELMRRENLLDLDNRKGKAPGGFCAEFAAARRPFIFMNAVGVHDDVQTLLHEGGHAFHFFDTSQLPYHPQKEVGMEFAEVASMGMELLAAPYLGSRFGGFYTEPEAARARLEYLEGVLYLWPYIAVVDGFQHWAYTHAQSAHDPANCDACWADLWNRFMVGVDWSGLEQEMKTGWQRKLHIFQYPFYYIEYGLAQLGAVQVWRNALHDQPGAVRAYRSALALGGTVPLPQLYEAAGARLAFDAETLGEAVALVERTIDDLEASL